MKRSITLLVLIFGLNAHTFSQTADSTVTLRKRPPLKIFSELDLGLLVLTGGFSNFFGVRYGAHSFELGYQHFPSPDAFGGTPDGFKLTVEYIYSVQYSYFWFGTGKKSKKTDRGLYTRFIYQNKKQIVTEKSSGITKPLYSDLIGAELGYVWYFYKCFYLTPRIGALYYVKRPQGKDNEPVQVGGSTYDNDRHKTWDLYYIPTISIGFSLPVTERVKGINRIKN